MLEHLIAHALGRTRGGQFFNMMMMLVFVAALPIGAVVGMTVFTWHEIAKENDYHRRFGEHWQAQYEVEQGSLSGARTKVVVAVLAAVAIAGIGIWLYRQLLPALRGEGSASYSPGRRRRRRRKR